MKAKLTFFRKLRFTGFALSEVKLVYQFLEKLAYTSFFSQF